MTSAHALIEYGAAGTQDDLLIEEFLASARGSMVYYTPKYRTFLKSILPRSEDLTLVARDRGRIVGLLPLFIKRNERFGDVVNSLPFFGSHGGPLVDDTHPLADVIATSLCQKLAGIFDGGNFASATLVENPFVPLTDRQAASLGFEVVDDRIGQFLGLPAPSDDLRAVISRKMHQKTRNAVRKGQSLGLMIEEREDMFTLAWLHSVHENSIRSLGGSAKPFDVFEALVDAFKMGKSARLFVAEFQGQPVAGILFLTHLKTVEYFTPVVEPDFREQQALSALIFECMSRFASEGYTLWNWGGTWRSQDGVYRFKQRWGSESRVYRYFNRLKNGRLRAFEQDWVREQFPYYYVYRFTS